MYTHHCRRSIMYVQREAIHMTRAVHAAVVRREGNSQCQALAGRNIMCNSLPRLLRLVITRHAAGARRSKKMQRIKYTSLHDNGRSFRDNEGGIQEYALQA